MSFRKLKAGKIFDGYRFIQDSILVITDEGRVEGIIAEEYAGEGLEVYEGIISPGLINCHCHLELSHMKGIIPEKTGLVDFVFEVVTGRHHPDEEMLQAIENAEEQMLQNGIVAVGDICNNALTISQKKKQQLQYYNFIEASGWLPAVSKMRFERARELFDEFSKLAAPCTIVPHAPYSVSENLWKELQPFFEDKVVTIHNQEAGFEDEFFRNGRGDFVRMFEMMKIDNTHHQPTNKSSFQSYFDMLAIANKAILVHNTFTTQEDIDHLKLKTQNSKLQAFFCLCPNANKYIEDSVPPVEMFRKNNCTIVLGTDSLASNWSLDLMDEIKCIREKFANIPLEEFLQWATINGAEALQMESRLGSFDKGKVPGVILINEQELSSRRLL